MAIALREAIAAVLAADGLVVAIAVLTASPSEVFDSFSAGLGDGVLSGMPVLPALKSGSRRQPPDLAQVIRARLTDVHADPCPSSSSRAPPAGAPQLRAARRGCAPASASRRRAHRCDALAPVGTETTCFEFEADVPSSTVASNSKQSRSQ
ncbi:hypothetical protein [Streptomyces canus]|uniref:hypothetical protein n=1 Tax=Streptomyces canus TaxID=58343 RepID=UPI00131A237A|nr:hypothetical protein [Streptomyces canus]